MSTRIKFCGITNLEDAEAAVQAGAWALGMIFFRQSPRRCGVQEAAQIATALRRQSQFAGVFVNPSLEHVAATADAVGLDLIQLHGDEGPAFCAEVARRTGARVIKAARVRTRADIQALERFRTDFHLLDGYAAGLPGGTGETFAWELVAGHPRRVPLILSGGLTPANVAAGIEAVRPFAVDVASGTEAAPGRKDPDKLRAFAAAVAAIDQAQPVPAS